MESLRQTAVSTRVRSTRIGLGGKLIDGSVTVVSPHLDDAALSLGETIARLTAAGVPVTIMTVFAGDPSSRARASSWDRRCGFETEGESATRRRYEDSHAAACLGARVVWLPFASSDYAPAPPAGVLTQAVLDACADSAILLPGYPLTHPDHRVVAGLAVPPQRTAYYVEQPYAAYRRVRRLRNPGREFVHTGGRSLVHWRCKQRALAEYRSQLKALPPLVRSLITVHTARRGESIAWCQGAASPAVARTPFLIVVATHPLLQREHQIGELARRHLQAAHVFPSVSTEHREPGVDPPVRRRLGLHAHDCAAQAIDGDHLPPRWM